MKNQTNISWLRDYPNDNLGLGVFLVPNPFSEQFGAAHKVSVPSISYPECIKRGSFCIAFQWIPQTMVSDLNIDTETTVPQGEKCVDYCYEPGTLCNEQTGVCQ